MKLINHIREFYGFPQTLLAQYVGVSRGHFSMASIGRRDLQTAAFLKLSKFALAEKNVGEPDLETIKARYHSLLGDKSAGFVKHKILETQHRLIGCQRKLHRMQIKYRQAIHSLACLAVLQANPGDPDIEHYKVLELFTLEILDKNSELAQFELELRITGLKATADFLRQRVAAGESLAATHANPDPLKPVKIFAGVQLDNKIEVAQGDPGPRPEKLKDKPTVLPGRPAAEGSLTTIPANPGDLHKTQDALPGIAAPRRLDENSEVTASDLELPARLLNTRADLTIPVFTKQRFLWQPSAVFRFRTAKGSRKVLLRTDHAPVSTGYRTDYSPG